MLEPEPGKRDKKRISRRKFIVRSAFTVAGVCALDSVFLEPRWPQVVHTRIPIAGLASEFDGYRIALLSDFHYDNNITADFIRHCIKLAADESPDVLLFLGDYVHSKKYFGGQMDALPDIRSVFADVPTTRNGAFGVLGNHDHWFDAAGVRQQLRHTPIKLVDNASVIVKRNDASLALVGTADFWEETIQFASTFAPIPPDTPRIVLQHNPDMAEICPPQYRVDLQVSGHTHGGQVRIPFGPAPMVPSKYGNKYRAGLVQGPRHPVYVTRGIGVSSPLPLRFCCRPEVTVLSLVRA